MEEQLIELETAKLAKEKGFDEPCQNMITPEGERQQCLYEDIWGHHNSNLHTNFSAPTQSLLKRWLREKHGLYVEMNIGELDVEVWNYRDTEPEEPAFKQGMSEGYETYEEALEDGLLEALKLVLTKEEKNKQSI